MHLWHCCRSEGAIKAGGNVLVCAGGWKMLLTVCREAAALLLSYPYSSDRLAASEGCQVMRMPMNVSFKNPFVTAKRVLLTK